MIVKCVLTISDERHHAKVKSTYSPFPLLQLTAVTNFIFVTRISVHFPLPSFHFPYGGILPSSSSPPSNSQQLHVLKSSCLYNSTICEFQLPWQHEGFVFSFIKIFFALLISALSAVKHSDLIDNLDALWLIFVPNETL